MYDINKEKLIINYLKDNLSLKRYNHSLSVAITAVNLATYYKTNIIDTKIAGLLHDMAKELSLNEQIEKLTKYGYKLSEDDMNCPAVIHGFLGAYMAKELFDINDEVFYAIKTHSMGEANMSVIQKIIYISDYVEPFRDKIDNIDYLRKLAYKNLDECVYYITEQTLNYLKKNKKSIHIDTYKTLDFYKIILNKG